MAKKSTASQKNVTKKTFSESGKLTLSFKQAVSAVVVLSIVLLGVSGWFWWKSILTDPDRVLSDMLARSLQTKSVTRNITQEDQQSALDQSIRLNLSPVAAAQTVTTLSQAEQNGVSRVTTETIGTNREDFVRYRSIESSAEGVNQKALENIAGVWSKREAKGQPPTFLNESLLSIVPFGNLNKEDRKTVLNILKDKKVYSYTKATRKSQDGRQVLVYEMTVAPQGLVEALAAYSRLSGLGEQPQLDPKAYAEVPPIGVEMVVDIMTRDLLSIKYTDSDRLERYQSAGLRTPIPVPAQSIAFTELQKRLQGLQQN